jgi:hypothetical protein
MLSGLGTRRLDCLFPLVRRHKMRNAAGNLVTELRHSSLLNTAVTLRVDLGSGTAISAAA